MNCTTRATAAEQAAKKNKKGAKQDAVKDYLREARKEHGEALKLAGDKEDELLILGQMDMAMNDAEDKIQRRDFDGAIADLDRAFTEYGNWEASRGPAPVAVALPAFVSLQQDADDGRYVVEASATQKIRQSSGEGPFPNQAKVSVEEAVTEAINGLDLTGSISFAYSRHDFQPTSSGHNLQVQLGGSKLNYRRGQGDTSATLVVVEKALWDRMSKADPARWTLVLQAAHRQSFNNRQKIELRSTE